MHSRILGRLGIRQPGTADRAPLALNVWDSSEERVGTQDDNPDSPAWETASEWSSNDDAPPPQDKVDLGLPLFGPYPT